jgi:hypothetical protein
MKDIIYPTIKRQFDKLTPHVSYDDDSGDMTVEFFYGNSDNDYLVYEEFNDTLYISIGYFMLKYFGYNEYDDDFNNLLSSIFTELINDKLGFPAIQTKGGNGPYIWRL